MVCRCTRADCARSSQVSYAAKLLKSANPLVYIHWVSSSDITWTPLEYLAPDQCGSPGIWAMFQCVQMVGQPCTRRCSKRLFHYSIATGSCVLRHCGLTDGRKRPRSAMPSDGLTIYFLCDPTSQKVANLARDDRVSLAIDDDPDQVMEIKGLSMAAPSAHGHRTR